MTVTLRARRLLAVLAVTAATCAACAVPSPAPAPAQPRPAASPDRAGSALTPGIAALLPVTPARLEAAAALAARFAAAYDTRQPRQTPVAWLARLLPMATPQLARALAQAAATPALWPAGQAATAQSTGERARDITPASVIFTVQLRLALTTPAGHATRTDDLAVTVTASRGGWAVYDIEPATAGND